jgi:hypothetical protein
MLNSSYLKATQYLFDVVNYYHGFQPNYLTLLFQIHIFVGSFEYLTPVFPIVQKTLSASNIQINFRVSKIIV